MRRLSLVVVAMFIALCGSSVFAQANCPQPVISQTGGSNPSCAAQPVTLDAGDGWASYLWSNGATTRVITDSPSSTTIYTVTTADANGCSVTSAPMQISVSPTPAAPTIGMMDGPKCPGVQVYVNAEPPPDTTYSSYKWSITNGSIVGQDYYQFATFTVDGSADAVLTVVATDSNGCAVSAHKTIAVRHLDPPVISVYRPSVCAGSTDGAYVMPPSDPNIHYTSYEWTIAHGTLTSPMWQDSASFTATGDAPVVLTVTVRDDQGCTATATTSIPIRTIAPPSIAVYRPSVCPGATDGAYVMPPSDPNIHYQQYEWTIQHGTLTSPMTYDSVSFTANGDAPVELTVWVRDDQGCSSSATTTIPIRTIGQPDISLYQAAACPGGNGGAYAKSPDPNVHYQQYEWTIQHGTLTSPMTYDSVSFTATGDAPVVLSLWVRDDQGCTATRTTTIPITDVTPALVPLPAVVEAGTRGVVKVSAPAGVHYDYVQWSVTGGASMNFSDNTQVEYTADGTGPVTVTATVSGGPGCSATRSVTMPLGTPDYVVDAPVSMCAGGSASAGLRGPQNTSPIVQWQLTNGVIDSQYGSSVWFHATGSGDVGITANITDANGSHVATSTIPLREPDITIYAPATYCSQYGVGFSVSAPGDTSIASVSWTISNGVNQYGNSQYISVTPIDASQPVTATATVTTTAGCTVTRTGTSNPMPVTTPVISFSPSPICTGNGYVTLSVVNADAFGGSYANYQWRVNGQPYYYYGNGSSITITPTGQPINVDVDVTPQGGCQSTGHLTVPFTALTPEPGITTSGMLCGAAGGSVTMTASSGGSAYHWRTGQTTPTITVTDPGLYSVTIDYPNGCSVEVASQVYRYTPPFIIGNGSVIPANGSVLLWVSSDYPVRTYRWSTGATTDRISVTQPGTYTLTVETYDGCTQTSSATVTSACPSTPSISASGPTTFCAGGNVTLSVPGTWSSYTWSNGAATPTITVSQSGNYSVTVRTSNGCALTTSAVGVTVNTPSKPAITANGATTFCAGGSVTLTSSAASSYAWSNGATTQSITVNASGSFTVTTTDANGCSAASDPTVVTVNTPVTPTITASPSATMCPASSVTLTASAGASYLWSTGATTQSIVVGNTNGDFTVTVTDANGCSATSAPMHTQVRPAPNVTITVPTAICSGTTGHASVAESFPYYSWIISGGTIVGASNGAAVDFTSTSPSGVTLTLLISDSNGCGYSYSRNVAVSPLPVNSITTLTQICINDLGTARVNANAGSSWQWTVTNASITGVFDDQGNPNPNGNVLNFRANAAGTVAINVTETTSAGCTGSWTRNVNVLGAPAANFTVTNPSVCPGDTGTASSSANWANYSWSITNGTILSGATSHDMTFRAGTTDPNSPTVITLTTPQSCSTPVTKSVDIPVLNVPLNGGSNSVCPNGSGYATVGSGYSSYAWSIVNGTITSGASSNTVWYTGGASGNVTLTLAVTYYGCSQTKSWVIPIEDTTPPAITAPDTICYDGTFTASVPAGYDHYAWWYNNVREVSVVPGTRSVMLASDGTGRPIDLRVTMWKDSGAQCQITSTKTITYAPTVVPTVGFNVPANFCTGMTGQASVTNGPYATYAWTITGGTISGAADGQTVSFIPDQTGSTQLTVRVTDGRGNCTATGYGYAPLANSMPSISASNGLDICAGTSTTLTASAGADAYLWSTGATTPSIAANATGDYSVTATKNGCPFTSSVHVNVYDVTATVTADTTAFCAGGTPARLTASYTGFRGRYITVRWYASGDFGYSFAAGTTATAKNYTETYYAVVTDENGCSARSSNITITVRPLPPSNITASGPTTFCQGGSVTLTAPAGSGYTYLWSNNATTQSIVVAATGSYTVRVTDTNGCASTTSTATSVTVNPVPDATITTSGSTTLCDGASVTLTAPSGYTYRWSNGATSQSITVSTPGNYSVTTTLGSCSTTSAPVAVVNDPTTVTISGDKTTVCPGGSLHLTSNIAGGTAASYQWFGFGGQAISGATSPTLDVTPSGSNTSYYFLRVVDGNGCTVQSNTWIYTMEAPEATITAPGAICSGDSSTASVPAQSGAAYAWTITGGTLTSPSNGNSVTFTSTSSSAQLGVTVTTPSGCTASSSATVSVNALPDATITAPASICSGSTATASVPAIAGATYAWTVTNGSVVSGATSNVLQFTSKQPNVSLSVTVTSASNCSSRSTANVAVNPLPTVTFSTVPDAVCMNVEAAQEVVPQSGVTYSWAITNGTITQNAGHRVYYIPTANPVTLVVTVTDDATGCSASDQRTIQVHTPVTPTISANGATTFCTNGSVTLTASAGYSYLWNTGETTQSITVSTQGAYNVTVKTLDGCSAKSADTNVVVNASPDATITAPSSICSGTSATASVPAQSGATYAWTITGGTITSASNTSAITFTSTGSSVVLGVTVTSSSNCSASSSKNVAVNALPVATITAPSSFCSGTTATASVPAQSGATYAWTISGGTITSGANTSAITFTSTGSSVALGVTVTSSSNCSTSSSKNVTVNAVPVATITAPSAICTGGSGTASVPVQSGVTYAWSITGGTLTSSATASSVTFTATTGTATLTATVTNTATSCSASSQKSVTVNALPNATITAPASICSGTSGTASVAAVSGATYAWTITGGTITAGAGTNSITFTSTTGPVSLQVSVTSNGCSSSSNASVTVTPATTLQQPANKTLKLNQTTTLTVTASGSNLTYKWYSGSYPSGTVVGTTQTITVGPYKTKGTYPFYVEVTGTCGMVRSAPVTVTVN